MNEKKPNYYQPIIFYIHTIKVKKKALKSEEQPFTFPFYAKEVFIKESDAIKYLPYYFTKLVENGDLPAELKDNKELYEKEIRTAIMPVYVSEMELDAE